MARVYTLPPIPGVKDLNTLMAFLANADEYEARMLALTTLEEEINAMILKVGPAEEIEVLNIQAAKALADAKAALAEAEEKAKAIVAEAENQADALEAKMVLEGEHMQKQAAALATNQDEFDTYKAEQENLLAEWEVKLKGREDAAAATKFKSDALIAEYSAKIEKLKALTI